MSETRDRLVEAAFALFEERGFDETTVDDIAARAGAGRTTFFRAFGSKEDVIFPDHDLVLGAISDRLATATPATASIAVTEAARLVLQHYLAEGSRAQLRYRLTRSVPALRAREVASQRQYQRTFHEYLESWMGDDPASALRAELMANAVVTAHNHVLRRWLRGSVDAETAESEFEVAMAQVRRLFDTTGDSGEASLVVLRTTRALDDLLPELRKIIESDDSRTRTAPR